LIRQSMHVGNKDKNRRLGKTPNTPGTKWAYNNDCIASVMQGHETSFKGAVIRLYLCRYPLLSSREECRTCGYVSNFLDSGFIGILSKVIEARILENR
jgi:hypothetical protein